MNKKNLISIQNDTLKLCIQNNILKKSIENSIKNTILYKEDFKFDLSQNNQKSNKYNISISKYRTFQCIKHFFLKNKNLKNCVLNFANAYFPGGAALSGARAQEESLCRASTLYPCLNTPYLKENYYKYHSQKKHETNRLFYIPRIIVFKTDENNFPELMKENDWYELDVITCAAHNQQAKELNNIEIFNLNYDRIKQILGSAISNNVDNIVLGAFGCGVFSNDPKIISRVFKKLLIDEEYYKYFINIHFAIFSSKNDSPNLIEFKNTFQKYIIEIEDEISEQPKEEKKEEIKKEKIEEIKKEKVKLTKDKKEEIKKEKIEEIKKEKVELTKDKKEDKKEEKKEKIKKEKIEDKKEEKKEENKEKIIEEIKKEKVETKIVKKIDNQKEKVEIKTNKKDEIKEKLKEESKTGNKKEIKKDKKEEKKEKNKEEIKKKK